MFYSRLTIHVTRLGIRQGLLTSQTMYLEDCRQIKNPVRLPQAPIIGIFLQKYFTTKIR